MEKLTYVTDGKRHLICVPYSIENLHRMAEELGIKKCWFHKNHYYIPKTRIEEIESQCTMVGKEQIVEIIKSPEYGHIIISEEVSGGTACSKDNFLQTQMQYNGDS